MGEDYKKGEVRYYKIVDFCGELQFVICTSSENATFSLEVLESRPKLAFLLNAVSSDIITVRDAKILGGIVMKHDSYFPMGYKGKTKININGKNDDFHVFADTYYHHSDETITHVARSFFRGILKLFDGNTKG